MTSIISRPASSAAALWQLPFGARVDASGATFRVWAPRPARVEVLLESSGVSIPMTRDAKGYHTAVVPGVRAGTRYSFRLDGKNTYADPCSRFQPEGPHGPSQVVDPHAFSWTDHDWRGPRLQGQVFYEMHIGTFTPEGTFDAAITQLDALVDLGVTCLEVMPVSEFPGRFNWGYDGVNPYAPSRNYGDADAFRRFIDAAHHRGLAVILDVVYNHLGPDGCYLSCYGDTFFSDKHKTEWGEALNFDGPGSEGVRDYFRENAAYWISEFHLDGLRLDATQNIYDDSPRHVLADISEAARRAAGHRRVLLIGENEPQNVRCVTPVSQGGFGLDAVWNDDFHHSARVAMTKFHEAYYEDYRGRPQELLSCLKRGYLFQGQHYVWQKKNRGTWVSDDIPAEAFVFYTQNHDQIANAAPGWRITRLTDIERYKAITALMLLAPQTPLLFMGQEYGAPQPFDFFADHNAELAPKVVAGRREFISQFPTYAQPERQAMIPSPEKPSTFEASQLRPEDRDSGRALLRFHRDLLRRRREDPLFARQDRTRLDGAVLGETLLAVRYFGDHGDDRLLLVSTGGAADLRPAPEPLLAPLAGGWTLVWSSRDPRYGGIPAASPLQEDGWSFAGPGAWLFEPAKEVR